MASNTKYRYRERAQFLLDNPSVISVVKKVYEVLEDLHTDEYQVFCTDLSKPTTSVSIYYPKNPRTPSHVSRVQCLYEIVQRDPTLLNVYKIKWKNEEPTVTWIVGKVLWVKERGLDVMDCNNTILGCIPSKHESMHCALRGNYKRISNLFALGEYQQVLTSRP